jgi:DNA-binding phage protein
LFNKNQVVTQNNCWTNLEKKYLQIFEQKPIMTLVEARQKALTDKAYECANSKNWRSMKRPFDTMEEAAGNAVLQRNKLTDYLMTSRNGKPYFQEVSKIVSRFVFTLSHVDECL